MPSLPVWIITVSLAVCSAISVSSDDFVPKLYYFDLAGKAEGIRLACEYSGFEFEDIRLTRDQFAEMKANGQLQFGQVPALEVREGVLLVQSAAILRFIGKKTGLYPVDHELAAAVDALVDQETDLFAGLTVAKYPERFGFGQLANVDEKIRKYIMEDILTDTIIRHLRLLETMLIKTDNNTATNRACIDGRDRCEGDPSGTSSEAFWLAGAASPTIAEFTLVPRIRDLQALVDKEMDFDILVMFPKLRGLIDRFYNMPAIHAYYHKQ